MSDDALTDWTDKWSKIKDASKGSDELSLFVESGKVPKTQRQLNLHNYFLFIQDVLKRKGDVREVLEIGCGRGTMALYLAKYIGLNLSLLDDSPDAIEVAKGEFSKHGQKGTYYVRDALETKLQDESFDAVVSIGLAEHFETPEDVARLFGEQYRLLRKGGVMVSLNIPKKFSVQKLNLAHRFFLKVFGKYGENVKKDYYRNSFKPKEYKKDAECACFRDVYYIYVNPFPIYTPLSVSKDHKITLWNRRILKLRSLFMKYPYKTNPLLAQAHFLVGYKK